MYDRKSMLLGLELREKLWKCCESFKAEWPDIPDPEIIMALEAVKMMMYVDVQSRVEILEEQVSILNDEVQPSDVEDEDHEDIED